MPDYSKSKIYKIVCNITGLIYIGSTCQTLCQRLQDHKYNYKKYLNKKYAYTSSFKILENDNYNIILVEEFPCKNKEQLLAKERFFIENTECVNMIIPTRTRKEYYQNNKEQIKEQEKEYCLKNKEKIKEYQKEYYEDNKEKIKDKRKEYLEKNKEQRKKYLKEYYKKNKEKFNQKRKTIP
jgi:hypothetical protein